MPDIDGYPTEEELKRIHEWPPDDLLGLIGFIKGIWWMSEWGVHVTPERLRLSTGGWSGNEDIILALQAGLHWFWMKHWESYRRGGHYVFRLKDEVP